ncbi:protein kinase domain-containing protein [Pengzhenrongella frigida]|uniref:protein kinase domain-containing protein n=1 Tax=Pengzhenrongella frigida TaxID=1259133 RepID=UPI0013ECF8EF|nr:PASTA domain-containing protein [Cellulomonas sp. HLT2-17]
MTDELVGGRYSLGRLLGSGGSGAVFEARDVRLGRLVAVKMLHAHLAAQPGIVAELLADAQTAARLDHPNLVRVLDAGADDAGPAWVATELVDGATLGDLVDRVGPLTPPDALRVVAGMLAGLAHAHAHDVLHLDVSPSNVMVPYAPGGFDLTRPQLLDLGSRPRPARTDPLVRLTPHYASPELATAAPADARADVYAVGAVLFYLLTGRPPFEREAHRAVLEAHVHAHPPAPSSVVAGLPRELDAIVATALAKDPADRFASATTMGVAVARAAAGIAARRGAGARSTRELAPVAARLDRVPAQPGPVASAEPATGRAGMAAAFTAVLVVGGLAAGAVAQAGHGADQAQAAPATPATEPSSAVGSPPAPAPAPGPADVPVALVDTAPLGTTVPALVGLPMAEVAGLLAAAGLAIGDVTSANSGQPAGLVLSSLPGPGESVPVGGAVAVVVASGTSIVPDVVGLARGAARGLLEGAGFVVVERDVAGGAPGTVTRTAPGSGTPRLVGDEVLLIAAPEAITPLPVPTPVPTAVPAPIPTPSAGPTASPGPVTSG